MGDVRVLVDDTDAELTHRFDQSGGRLESVTLHQGARVEVFRGPVKIGSATLSEPDRANWFFTDHSAAECGAIDVGTAIVITVLAAIFLMLVLIVTSPGVLR